MQGNTCTKQGHEGQQILAVCLYEQCKQPRAVCFLCMSQNQHLAHQSELKQLQQIDTFLNPKRQQFNEIINKVDQISQQFSHSINSLRNIVAEQYQPPNNFNGMGNQQIDQTVSKLTQYNYIQKLMADRLDNIFKNTLEQIKTTCYDLSSPQQKECFMLVQNNNLAEAKRKIDQELIKNPKNTLIMLLKGIKDNTVADILRSENLLIDAVEVYDRILSIEPNNAWAIQGRSKHKLKFNRRYTKQVLIVSYIIIKSLFFILMEQLQVGGVLFLASISFFFLGYLWARNAQKMPYDSLGSDDDDSQNQDRLIADLSEKVKQLTKQNEELQKKIGHLNKNTDL